MFARLALEDEEDAFVALAKQAVAESARHVGFSDAAVRRTFRRYIERANPTIFFADDRGEPVGFMMATVSDYTFAAGFFTTQEVIFVKRDKRGSRAAVLLLDEFIRWSDQLGAIENTGGNDNGLFTDRTERLLRKRGFERVGVFMRRIGAANGQEGR